MKKIFAGDGTEIINMVSIKIEFSKEIAYWGNTCYHENPKFTEWWDTKYNEYCKRNIKNRVWHVAYCNKSCQERAERGELESSVIRYLHHMDSANIVIAPTMYAILFTKPSEFPTTHGYSLYELAKICHACAKYCGGTVKFSYSSTQRRFIWNETEYKTLELGTGHSDNIATKEPKRTKTSKQVNHTWESNPKKSNM